MLLGYIGDGENYHKAIKLLVFYILWTKKRIDNGDGRMNLKDIIGETTDYDKKLALEAKKPKVGVKVSALLQTA